LLAGHPESADSYLKCCKESCNWNTFEYKKKSDEEKAEALKKLLSSKKWKEPLDGTDREFLASQMK